MTTAARHAGAPYVSGETLDGTLDLEVDINNIVTVINGNIDNGNIASAANIAGSKLADNSVTNAKLNANTITTAKMAASAVTKAQAETATDGTNQAFTSSATYVDVTGFSGLTVTPGSTSDLIAFDFTASVTLTTSPASVTYLFGASIDGAETDLQEMTLEAGGTDNNVPQIIHISYMVAAGTVNSIVVKPIYKRTSGTQTADFIANSLRVFRVVVYPTK